MLKTFNFNKTALLVATSAAVLGLNMNSTAQTVNLNLSATITNATCALAMFPSSGSTLQSGSTYNVNLGTWTQDAVSAATANGGTVGGTSRTTVFQLTDGSGGACNTTQRWDLSMDLSNLNVVTSPNNRTFITSQSISGVTTASNLGVTFFSGIGSNTDNSPATPTAVVLTNTTAPYGVLVAGSTSGAQANQRIALTAQLGRPGASAIGAGQFYATVPLTLLYR